MLSLWKTRWSGITPCRLETDWLNITCRIELADGLVACMECAVIEDLCCQKRSCGSRSADCAAPEMTRKRLTRCSLRPCSFKSLNLHLYQGRGGQCLKAEGWKLVTSVTKMRIPAPPEDLQLWKRFSALLADKGQGALSNPCWLRLSHGGAAERSSVSSGRLLAGGNRGPHLTTCFLGTFTACWDLYLGCCWKACFTLRLLPLPSFHMGTNNTAWRDLECIAWLHGSGDSGQGHEGPR